MELDKIPDVVYIPRTRCVGLYILSVSMHPGTLKIGWTRDINRRMWDYDTYAPEHKWYSHAILFEFRDCTSTDSDTFHTAQNDEHTFIETELERACLHALQVFHNKKMGTEWFEISVEDAVATLNRTVDDVLNTCFEDLPDIRPVTYKMSNFRTCRGSPVYSKIVHKKQKKWFEVWKADVKKGGGNSRRTCENDDIPVQPSVTPSMVQPRQHQAECLAIMQDHFKTHDNAHIVQACGVGKALLGVFFLKCITDTLNEPCLYVIGVPSVQLVHQMVYEVKRVFSTHPVLCVMSESISSYDDLSVTQKTSIKDIVSWNNNHMRDTRILITTYASSSKVADANVSAYMRMGDECHHLIKHDTRQQVHSQVADNEIIQNKTWQAFWNIETKQSIFFTATPLYADDDDDVYGTMSDLALFGERLTQCDRSVKWAIEHDCITDYAIAVIDHNANEVDTMMESLFPEKRIDDTFNMLFLSALVTLKSMVKYEEEQTCTHFLIYTNTIEQAQIVDECVQFIIENEILQCLPSQLYHKALHSKTKENVKDELKTFKASPYGIVSCAYLLSEGFDMKELNAVTIAAPMQAHIRITQSILRPHRKNPEAPNKKAMILLPTIDIDEYNHTVDKHANVRKLIDDLRDHDDACESKVTILNNHIPIEPIDKTKRPRAQHESPFDFANDHEKLVRFRVKTVRAGKHNPAARLQAEYRIWRNYNKTHNIATIDDYNRSVHLHSTEYIDNPAFYFENGCVMFKESVWKGWSDFLGHDTSKLPYTKNEWKKKCKDENIQTAEQYTSWVNKQTHGSPLALPHDPENFYKMHNEEFSSLTAELECLWQVKRRRRR